MWLILISHSSQKSVSRKQFKFIISRKQREWLAQRIESFKFPARISIEQKFDFQWNESVKWVGFWCTQKRFRQKYQNMFFQLVKNLTRENDDERSKKL